jgi:hypothetical protein
MPILSYFAVAGSALLGLLFLADAMLPAREPLRISTEFRGLKAALHGETIGSARAPAPAIAPEPDMMSEAVRVARQGTPEPVVNVQPVNQPVAGAEPIVPKKRKQVAHPRPSREQTARAREWRDQYAQGPDFGWNGGNDARRDDPWRSNSWRNDSWRNEPWRRETRQNDFWRNDPGRNDRRGAWNP